MKKKPSGRRSEKYILIILSIIFTFLYFGFLLPFRGIPFNAQRHGNPPLTPPWALECWLWEDDSNTAGRVDSLLDGYAKHDIPVGTILLDSPWSLRYNDFETDTVLYPKPDEWFKKLQDKGYRVVLWMTSMINSGNKDTRIRKDDEWFGKAAGNGFVAGNGDQIRWWKGRGGFIDYTSPEAIKWWRGMQQKVFDYGIDGWKLDGTATLFYTLLGPVPLFYKTTSKGLLTTRQYMDHYYRDEYAHGLSQNPEFITLVRAIDRGYHPEGFAPIDAAPVTWVGDQKHTWESTGTTSDEDRKNSDIAMDGIDGIELAISNIMKSAKLGYNVIGSDIAGFSGSDIPPRLYIRWAQFSTFCGLFLNGGHGERALWKRSQQELDIIRKFSWLHTELIPYMYSYTVTAHAGGAVLQRPVKGKYHYLFGDDFLVIPIYKDQLSTTINLPEGNWRYFFDDKETLIGPERFSREFPLEEFPVFIKEGAIVPLDVKRTYTRLGNETHEGYVTWLVYPGRDNQFTLYHPDKTGSSTIELKTDGESVKLNLIDMKKPSVFTIHLEKQPAGVTFNDAELTDSTDIRFDPVRCKLIVWIRGIKDGALVIRK